MTTKRGFNPFLFIWRHSALLSPARELITNPDHWGDYVFAAVYLVFTFAGVAILAFTLDAGFMIGLLMVAASVVAVKYAVYYLS